MTKDYQSKTDSLRHLFGFRKKIPQEYELRTLLAISHYPDLYRARIKFKFTTKSHALPISARPSFADIVHGRKNRHYKIVMQKDNSFVLSLNFNQQIGLIGHELAHIQFYRHKSFLSLIKVGFCYVLSRKYLMRFETDTDRRAMDYGLGWQLLDAPIYLDKEEVELYMKKIGYVF